VEFAYLYRAFGSRVTLIEMMPHLLPSEDEDVSALLERALSKQGIEVLTGTRVEELEHTDRQCRVRLSGREGEKAASYDKILLGVGIRANIESTGLLELNATITEGGFIDINDRMQSSVDGVYAVGDVTGVMPLAHVASAQGAAAAEAIAGRVRMPLVYSDMPRAVYSRPQVASVGLTQAAAEAQGYSVRAARFPVRANSKALAVGETEGFAKLVIDADSDEVIGCHMIGPDVTELIGGLSLARVLGARATDVASAVYPHPTLSEMVKEAALATKGEAVHFWFEKAAASSGSS
jgi:dihydrolipoamide dehydrogenase